MASDNSNFNNYITLLKDKVYSEVPMPTIVDTILVSAREKGCDIIQSDGSYYIKNGENPNALLHLNIDNPNNMPFNFTNYENDDVIISKNNINLISSAIIINYLLRYSDCSFDVLITNNNIQSDISNYKFIKNIIRTENIINLNLRQAKCIADEFSALLLAIIKVQIKRFKPDYEYKGYRLSISNLMGGHAGDNINKVRLNSIKLIIGIFRRMKAKVDIEMVSLNAGNRYDNIPAFSEIDFIINSKYESELLNIFEISKNDTIEKNLRYEPDMKIDLYSSEKLKSNPITSESFNHLASFIELSPTGIFSVNSIDDQVISSSNLATSRTLKNTINMIQVFRSLTEEGMNQMVEKSMLAAKISNSDFIKKIIIPRRKNNNDYLRDIFIKTYKKLNGDDLEVIKTQYSLDSSLIFNNVNVNIISIGVKYKQDDDYFLTSIKDITDLILFIENVLSNLKEDCKESV